MGNYLKVRVCMSYLRKNKEASVHVDEVRELRLGEGTGGQTVLDLVFPKFKKILVTYSIAYY